MSTPPIHNLTKLEFCILCFWAYKGELQPKVEVSLRKFYDISLEEYEEIITSLRSYGLMTNRQQVVPSFYFSIMNEMVDNYAYLRKDFETIDKQQNSIGTYLWRLYSYLRQNNFEAAKNLQRPLVNLGIKTLNLYPYVLPLLSTNKNYMDLLNKEELESSISEYIDIYFTKGLVDKLFIDQIEDSISSYHFNKQEILDEIAFYRYIVLGIQLPPLNRKSKWLIAGHAISSLYRRELSSSLQCFKEALKLFSKKVNAFPYAILNFYYAIALLKTKKTTFEKEWEIYKRKFQHSSTIYLQNNNFAVRMLMDNIDIWSADMSELLRKQVAEIISWDDSPLWLVFAILIKHFYNVETNIIEHKEKELLFSSILRHELSAFVHFEQSEKDELKNIFEGEPLLCSIRKTDTWERLLIDVLDESNVEHCVLGRRIVYCMNGMNLSSLHEQVKSTDGTWKYGNLLSRKMLLLSAYDFMDVVDIAIATKLSSKPSNVSDAAIIIPLLKNTDRVVYGDYITNNLTTITVNEIAPYIRFYGYGEQIHVSSNIELDETGDIPKHIVSFKDNEYELTSINSIQKNILKRFLQQKTFPSTALHQLQETIKNLTGIIIIENQLKDFITTTPHVSEGMIAVRITPQDLEYKIQIMAAPLDGGSLRLEPGIGNNLVYDQIGRVNYFIQRNKSKENDNCKIMHDFLDKQIRAEFLSYYQAYVSTSENLLHILSFIHNNPTKFFAEWPEGKPLKFKGVVHSKDIHVHVQTKGDWFQVEGEVVLNGKIKSLYELIALNNNSDIKGYIRVGKDEYMRMSETLKRHIKSLDAIPSSYTQKQEVPKYQIGVIAEALAELNANTDEGYIKQINAIKNAFSIEPELPNTLLANLYYYQIEGYKWLKRLDTWGAGACLADDMGLGKTLQVLAFIASKAQDGPALVVAPKSVLPNWVAETNRFVPSLDVQIINDMENRSQGILNAGANTLLLCTYGVLSTIQNTLIKKQWNVVCLDEAHCIKNHRTITAQAAINISHHASSRIAITGTPLQNHLGELWSIFQFINPGMLGKWYEFESKYMKKELDMGETEMLHGLVMPFILRRTKEMVLHQLPEKNIIVRRVELSQEEMCVYEEKRKLIELFFKKHKTTQEKKLIQDLPPIIYFEELTKLRMAACDMRLTIPEWKDQSSKIESLLDILDTLCANPENKILIFSQFVSFLNYVKKELDKRKWKYLYMDGSTSMKKRKENINAFQQGETQLFISSIQTGGVGINLTAANYVILLDPWWNPAIENQAMDRAHRMGQNRCVTVIRLISEHTIEEKILRLHETKQDLSDSMLSGTSETYKLTYNDILDLVSSF